MGGARAAGTLYVIQHRDYSGAEISQAPIIRADPDALVACPAGSRSEAFARGLGARTVELPFHSLRSSGGPLETVRSALRGLRSAAELWRIVRRNPEREVIYGVGLRPCLIASLATLGLRRRVVWSVQDLLPPGPLAPAIRLIARLRADRVLCLSRFIAEDFVKGSSRLARRADVVHPGIDAARFDPETAAPGEPVAAIVGHISPVKRTDLAVDIAAAVADRQPTFRLRVIGAAQFRDEDFGLEREIRSRLESDDGLRRTIELAGRQADVAAALAGTGALLHCRSDEPFGMVMVEAMAMGLPVVAPRSGGALEIVEDGVTGLLYRPGDREHAAECLLRLIREPDLAQRMGQGARRRVEQLFSAARQVELTNRLLGRR